MNKYNIGDNMYTYYEGENGKYALHKYEVILWVENKNLSQISLYHEEGNNLAKMLEECANVQDLFEEEKLVRCANCGKLHKLEDMKDNRYYAGIYCDKCYNDPDFVKERNEDNYD